MRQEISPNNDLLESWERMSEILHHKQLKEQKEMMSR